MKTWDIEKSDIKFEKGELQENVRKLYKKYGDNFYIKYKKTKLPVYLYEKEYEDKKRKTFVLKYATKDAPNLWPFMIELQDRNNLSNKNNVYIYNINKIDKKDYPKENPMSGSEMVEFVLEILKKLYVEKAYLNDGATLDCDGKKLTLSIFKLIEKKRTFYMKFGFKPELEFYQKLKISDMNTFNKLIEKSIKNIKNYRIINLRKYCQNIIDVIIQIYKKNDFDKADIITSSTSDPYTYYTVSKENKLNKFAEKLNQMIKLLNILPKFGSLGTWLKKTFYKNCSVYSDFFDIILYSRQSTIKYKNKLYKNPLRQDFELLDMYADCNFVIDLTKNY